MHWVGFDSILGVAVIRKPHLQQHHRCRRSDAVGRRQCCANQEVMILGWQKATSTRALRASRPRRPRRRRVHLKCEICGEQSSTKLREYRGNKFDDACWLGIRARKRLILGRTNNEADQKLQVEDFAAWRLQVMPFVKERPGLCGSD